MCFSELFLWDYVEIYLGKRTGIKKNPKNLRKSINSFVKKRVKQNKFQWEKIFENH